MGQQACPSSGRYERPPHVVDASPAAPAPVRSHARGDDRWDELKLYRYIALACGTTQKASAARTAFTGSYEGAVFARSSRDRDHGAADEEFFPPAAAFILDQS